MARVYITDMYHGIIQVGNFAGPGTYLRARIQQYDLDKVIHKGRIWRLVYDGVKPDRSDRLRRDPIRAAHEQRDARPSSSRISAIRTAGGATRRSNCSS